MVRVLKREEQLLARSAIEGCEVAISLVEFQVPGLRSNPKERSERYKYCGLDQSSANYDASKVSSELDIGMWVVDGWD